MSIKLGPDMENFDRPTALIPPCTMFTRKVSAKPRTAAAPEGV